MTSISKEVGAEVPVAEVKAVVKKVFRGTLRDGFLHVLIQFGGKCYITSLPCIYSCLF